MTHLTDEQLEDLMPGDKPEPEHLRTCAACRARLAECRALGARLQYAFVSLRAPSDLKDRILGATQSSRTAPASSIRLHVHRRLWSGLAAAAVLVLCAVPVGLFWYTSSQVDASQKALMGIHHLSLDHPDMLFRADDPNRLADRMEGDTGQRPKMLRPCEKVVICGGRSCTFQGRKVPTYMVDTAAGRVSVVLLDETPEKLGMKPDAELGYWIATCQCCRMAATRLGDDTYYALGEVPHAALAEVLGRLVP